jgi:hypothetical protein
MGQIIVPKGSHYNYRVGIQYTFVMSLRTGPSSEPCTFGIYALFPDSSSRVYFLKSDIFLAHITAKIKSPANPDSIDFLKLYNIENETYKNLWKLKSRVYPFQGKDEIGWGGPRLYPTPQQFDMLKPYGISNVQDFVVGDDIWKLLQKMQDPLWVNKYQGY